MDPPREGADARRSLINQHDLLITIVGAGAGDTCYVPHAVKDHFVCQSVALIRLKKVALAEFYSYWFNCASFVAAP